MNKKNIIITMVIILFLISMSGCTFKSTTNKTFGEKDPAKPSDLYVINSTSDSYDYNNTTRYVVWGYIGNKAQKDASNVTILVKFYSENGTLIGNNTVVPYKPKNVPAEGKSRFYVGFEDPDQQITNYTIELSIK